MSGAYDETVYASRPAVPGHGWASLSRFPRGMTPIRPARPVYGWRWRCECGATDTVNEVKRIAVGYWRDHRRNA